MKNRSFIGNGFFQYLTLITSLLILPFLKGRAQSVSLTTLGSAYTQNFDGLASTSTSSVVPSGWAFAETGGNNLYTAGTGSGTAGDTYSFGASLATDRAFGTLLSGSVTSTLGVSFTNNTGATITSLDISYIGEEWRFGATGRADQLNFEYSLNATSLTTGVWTPVTALNFISPNTATVVGAVNGNITGNRTSVSSTIGSLSIAVGGTVWIRWTDFNATGSDDGLGIDDFSLTPSGAAPTLPTHLAITTVTPSSPLAGSGFTVVVQSQDGSNIPQNVTAITTFSLSTNGNAGSIGGTITGSIALGANSTTVTGVTLSTAGTNVNLTATATGGSTLTAGTSATFAVIGTATQLAFVGTPALGFSSVNMAGFTIEARKTDNSVDNTYTGAIIVSKASGPGTLTGTTSVNAVAGVATFTAIQFNQTGVYTLNVTSGALTPAISSSINISSNPVTWDFASGSISATGIPANLMVSPISQGNNNGVTTLTTTGTPSSGYPGASGTYNAGAAARTGAINTTSTASTGSAYLEFTLTPAANNYVTLKGLTFGSRSTSTGPQAFSVRSSADGYVSTLSSGTTFSNSTWALSSPSFSSITSGLATPITFRIYGHNGVGSPGANVANWRLDDILLDVSVQSCIQPTITVNSGAICTGNTFTITPNGGVTYSITGNSFTVNPISNASYTVTGADAIGCTNTAVTSVTVNTLPNVNITGVSIICSGNTTTLTASGATSYLWNTGATTTAVSVSPTTNTTYTVTGVDGNGCSNTAVNTVTVNALPNVDITGASMICSGNTTTLTASGATSYLWNTGATTTAVSVSPTTNTTYTVTGVDGNGCSNTVVNTVTVNALPNVDITGASSICPGNVTTLTASGAISYLWNTSENTTAISVSPSTNTTYTVTGVDGNGCSNTAVNTVTVNALPNVDITGASSVCSGNTTTLTASGAISYLWNTGANTTAISVSPTTNTTYTVTGMDGNGCSNTAVNTITVNALPNVNIAGTSTLCAGTSSVLTASGASTYIWSNGSTSASTSISPTVTTNYSVTGVDGNGCSGNDAVSVTVISCSAETAVSTVSCGLVVSNMALTSSAANVTGALQYRFNFYNNTTNVLVATKTQASRTLTFSTVSGIYYGNTYKWTVAVDKGIGFGPESSNGCTITFNPPKTNLPCGYSFANLNSYSYCTAVSGASGYRFIFYDNTTNAVVAAKAQVSNNIYFNTVPGLAYGQTYKWTAEVLYNNGTTSIWGPSSSSLCTISFSAPQTTLPCGNTYPATNASVGFPSVSGATYYRVTFYDATTNALVATKVLGSNYVYFNQIPGLAYNNTYKWTVEVYYNNVYGAPSSSNCLVTWGSAGSIVMNGETLSSRLSENGSESTIADEPFLINLYPNPNNGLFNLELNTSSQIIVTNTLGQVIINETIEAGIHNLDIQKQSTGIYFVKAISNNKQHIIKLIKE